MEKRGVNWKRPHVVCMPYPVQSHMNGMLSVAKLFHEKGFHITLINTEFNHDRILRALGPNSLDGTNHFRFETIPDGLPPSDPNATQNPMALMKACESNFLSPFRKLVLKLNKDAESFEIPKITFIIADVCMFFTFDAVKEFGIPVSAFWPISANATMDVKKIISDNGYAAGLKQKDEGTVVDCTQSGTSELDGSILNFCDEVFGRNSNEAFAHIFNTFMELEQDATNALSFFVLGPIYPIGPLHLLVDRIPETSPIKSIRFDMWKEDSSCIHWLDSRRPGSVIYINYGCIAVLTSETVTEFAWALAESKHNFLWVIRPDLVGGESAILPDEFLKETRERGFICSWCPQEEVLNHSSIGVFVTHVGWNSMLESLSAGVPMICWPYKWDQQPNTKSCCEELKIGMQIESDFKREDVEMILRKMMEGEDLKDMKERANEWKKLARQAIATNGSSLLNLDSLVQKVISISRFSA